MTKDLPAWLDEDADEGRPAAGRRWVLAALATLPWLVVVALLLTGSVPGGGGSTSEGGGSTSESVHPVPSADATPEGADDPAASTLAGGIESRGHDTPAPADAGTVSSTREAGAEHAAGPAAVDPAMASLAKVIARAWLTDVGPRLRVEGIEPEADRYLEQAMVEAVDVHEGLAVATVVAVVLRRDGDHYADVALQRLAVPMRVTDAGPRPAGQPWWLPDAELRPHPPEPTPDHDPDLALAVAELLTEQPYEDVAITHLARHGRGWLIAEVAADLPDGRRLRGPVWLRETAGGPRLIGSAPGARDREGPDSPQPDDDHEAPTPNQDHSEEKS